MKKSVILENIIISAIFLLSIFFLIFRYTNNTFPGDLGDTIFSLFILESFFNSLINNNSFVDLNYQFPLKNNIFFSETMWGSAWIYSIYRFVGFETLDSFKFYFITCHLLNFLICLVVLRKFKLSLQASIVASFFFSFSLPILAHDMRPQLLLRFYTPLSIYFYYKYSNKKKLKFFTLSIFFLFMQTISSMYLGIFLLIFLFSYHIIKYSESEVFENYNFKNLFMFKKLNFLTFLILSLLIGLFLYYFFIYYSVKSTYDFKRGYPQSGLINFFSFFSTERSIFFDSFRILPLHYSLGEQQLYPGLSFFIFLFFLYKKKIFNETNKIYNLIKKITFINILIYFSIFGISFFLFLYYLPGFSGIRAPSRSILILIFPISLLIGFYIDKFNNYKSRNFYIIKYFLIFLLIFEICSANVNKIPINIIEKKILDITKKLENTSKDDILIFKQSDNYVENYHNDTFISLVSVINNRKTFNGLTSFVPKFNRPLTNCNEIKNYILAINSFHQKKKLDQRIYNISNLKLIDFERDCFK